MSTQVEPAGAASPAPGGFAPAAPPSPALQAPLAPAPLPPALHLGGVQPGLGVEPIGAGALATFAALPGFAASLGERSPACTPSLPPPPPPSPPTPAAYPAAAAVGSPPPAPAFSLGDANALLEAMKVSLGPGVLSILHRRTALVQR